MNHIESDLLIKLADVQKLAIEYVSNGCQKPHYAWLGNASTNEIINIVDGLTARLKDLVYEQYTREVSYKNL